MVSRSALSAAAVGVLLLGCESVPERPLTTETKWELVTLHGKPPVPTPKPLTAEFRSNGRLQGFGGVNRFEIGMEIHGKWISPQKEISSTLIGSTIPVVADQESAFTMAIGRTRSYLIDDADLLHFYDADGNELATLKRVPR